MVRRVLDRFPDDLIPMAADDSDRVENDGKDKRESGKYGPNGGEMTRSRDEW